MGWLSMPLSSMGGFTTPKAYLDDQFTYTRTLDGGATRGMRVIASAVTNRVWYAATEIIENDEVQYVIALVCLVRWTPKAKDGFAFAYKDMEESMGPYEAACPERILKLLSPTTNERALDWRERCRERLRRRKRSIADGMRVRFPAPIKFSDGHVGTEFILVRRGSRITFRCDKGFGHYRIANFRDLPWTVVPVTKVHATVFAKPSTYAMPG